MQAHRTPLRIDRRKLLALVTGLGLGVGSAARAADWMPYAASEVIRIEPRLTPAPSAAGMPPPSASAASVPTVTINPILTDFTAAPRTAGVIRGTAPAPGATPPRAYVRVAARHGVAPWLLYGVALQESQLKFGARTLPYPWTLGVSGRGLRYGSYRATVAGLRGLLRRGTTNVDCGAMQVNWHWHNDRLASMERALDPYPNLNVGAAILREQFGRTRNWRSAVALYHTGSSATAEQRSRGARYAAQTIGRLQRLGIDTAALLGERRRG